MNNTFISTSPHNMDPLAELPVDRGNCLAEIQVYGLVSPHIFFIHQNLFITLFNM